jgi:hypothetical protein
VRGQHSVRYLGHKRRVWDGERAGEDLKYIATAAGYVGSGSTRRKAHQAQKSRQPRL